MLRRRRTDLAKSVCARRCQWPSELTNNGGKNRMSTDSHRDCVQTSRDDVWNDVAFGEDDREWPRPEAIGQLQNQLSILRRKIDNSLEPIAIRQMNNERIEARSFFRFEDSYDRCGVERVGGESINRLGR